MKKSLLAVAVAAALPAFAYAQTNVTLSGILKTGISYTDYDKGVNEGDHLALTDGSSRFIISGSEDLGGGLKAIFQYDTRVRVDDGGVGNNLGGGNTFLGLSGGFGTIRLGRLDTYYFLGIDEHGARATSLQHSNISILSYVGNNTNAIARASRSQNMVRYDTPTFSGIKGGLNWSPGAATTEGATMDDGNKGNAWSADIGYAAGPLSVGAAYWDEKNEGYKLAAPGALTGQQSWRVFGSYNFGIFKVGLIYDESKVKTNGADIKRPAWSIPLTAKLGPGTVLFTYSQAQDLKIGGNKQSDSGANMFVLGYDYPLSKRTSLGVSYAQINNDGNAAYGYFTASNLGNLTSPEAGQDQKQFYVGLRHAF